MAVERDIVIIGCGPGSRDYLTPAAIKAARDADLLVGAQRLLNLFSDSAAQRIMVAGGIQEALDKMEATPGIRRVAVLVTGDPGLFSFAKLVIKRFGRDRCRIIPGISSVQEAFARIALDWEDARIISAHKENPEAALDLSDAEKIAVLCGREGSLQWVAERLSHSDAASKIFVCQNLTLESEHVTEVTVEELTDLQASSRTIVLIIRRSLLA
jgi:precorrin-6y C5,15-methyltransferase (decarboxylating) CbiE subunit